MRDQRNNIPGNTTSLGSNRSYKVELGRPRAKNMNRSQKLISGLESISVDLSLRNLELYKKSEGRKVKVFFLDADL